MIYNYNEIYIININDDLQLLGYISRSDIHVSRNDESLGGYVRSYLIFIFLAFSSIFLSLSLLFSTSSQRVD